MNCPQAWICEVEGVGAFFIFKKDQIFSKKKKNGGGQPPSSASSWPLANRL